MASRPQIRAWDADTLIGWLGNEPNKHPICEPVIRSAERGEVRIVVSTLAVAEVIKLRHHDPIPKESQALIRNFFRQDYIFMRNVDPASAFLAQELTWDHNINPKDAVHVATALRHGVGVLDTFDNDLIGKGPLEVPNYSRLIIGQPNIENYQPPFDFPTEDDDG